MILDFLYLEKKTKDHRATLRMREHPVTSSLRIKFFLYKVFLNLIFS